MLAGGVGAARLLRGLARLVEGPDLTIVVNTGDDERFYGLDVSPDLDTIVYTLAGVASRARGWGIEGDGFTAQEELRRLYGEAWFAIGDRDLATNLYRSERLASGLTLSEVTAAICDSYGIEQRVLPMSDDRVRTLVFTRQGRLSFQDFLVRQGGRPRVERVAYAGVRRARPAPGVLEAVEQADVVVIAPSNPFVSIGPIVALPGVRAALRRCGSRVVAVSPLIGGRAVKGPLDGMLRSMGHGRGTEALAAIYANLAATLVVAPGDGPRRRPMKTWPEIIEHDILIADAASAESLSRFLLARCGFGEH